MFFEGNYGFLSNFYPTLVRYKGKGYRTAEHAYQAQKCIHVYDQQQFLSNISAAEAKRLGRNVKIRSDWEHIKYEIMKEIVIAKFKQNSNIRDRLIRVTDEIVEHNTWHDIVWGKCICKRHRGEGRNWLGKILTDAKQKFYEEGGGVIRFTETL